MSMMSTPVENDNDRKLEELRTDKDHDQHHARGDVGGEYHDQEGTDEHLKAGVKAREDTKVKRDSGPILVVVMGVSGCGKSTVGAALAKALQIPFADADELHPQSNIDKMSQGIPLTDADRQPWLERVRAEAVRACEQQTHDAEHTGPRGIVIGCSSLKRSYRDVLRGHSHPQSQSHSQTDSTSKLDGDVLSTSPEALPTYFVHIRGTRDDLMARMQNRKGHFMKASMLDSQLQTLEPPEETGEPNVATVDLMESVDEQIQQAKDSLRALGVKV